jgi:flagellar assembly protein FliH
MSKETPKLGEALNEAQSIIEAAEARAKETIEKAEKIYLESKEAGYREGIEQGHKEVAENAVRMIEEAGAISDKLAKEAAQLAISIASFVVGEQVKVTPKTVQRIALKALKESVFGENIRIAVSDEDEKVMKDSLAIIRRAAGGASIAIEVDSDITRGGCIIRTDFGEVDASIEALIDAISSRLGLISKKNKI